MFGAIIFEALAFVITILGVVQYVRIRRRSN